MAGIITAESTREPISTEPTSTEPITEPIKTEVFAEQYCHPSYKWIGDRRLVTNMQSWRISSFPGAIGFAFQDYASSKALRVVLKVYREDGVCDLYVINGYCCGDWGHGWQKWQTHQLPLFPYEGLHGRATHVTFSYIIHKDGRSIPSQYDYKFATLDEFHRGWISSNDFDDGYFKHENTYRTCESNREKVQDALKRINKEYESLPVSPFFTRGNTTDPYHPIHEIHRHIDYIIQRKEEDPQGRHTIRLAIFDPDNHHISKHLVHAKEKGVEVECIADWAAVSPMNITENIARLKRAGIPVIGVVRNTPGDSTQGIASMHTKIFLFDGMFAHSSSYNLHFHLWGGNWENGMVYYSKDFYILYENIYNAIKGGVIQPVLVTPEDKYNVLYSFGAYSTERRDFYRPEDAIVTEINNARHSIIVSMFDMSYMRGISSHDLHETDVINALINARNRGVYVKIILNGMITHTGALPEHWDKERWRPLKGPIKHLKDAWMDMNFVYYHESVYSPLHHKFAVFDNYTVITESYNWYEASLYSDEVLSVVRDEGIAHAFTVEANKICESFRIRGD